MIRPSLFDAQIFGKRIAWSDEGDDLEGAPFDLVFLRGGYPCVLHPRATYLDVRYDLVHGRLTRVAQDLHEIFHGQPGPGSCLAIAGHGDLDACRELARSAFSSTSRYFRDARLRERAPLVYERWVEGAFDRGNLYVNTERSGFVAVSRSAEDLRIDLIAVAPAARGRGVGGQLLRDFRALAGPFERRVRVEVGNFKALHSYELAGFKIESIESVQHLWLS